MVYHFKVFIDLKTLSNRFILSLYIYICNTCGVRIPNLSMMMTTTKTRNTFLSHFVLFLSCFVLMEVGLGRSPTSEIKVGVTLDLKTTFSKICLTSLNMSLSDFYEDHPNYRTRLAIHVRDSMEDVVQASAAGSFLFSLLLLFYMSGRYLISYTYVVCY